MKTRNKFLVDTKTACFLCFKNSTGGDDISKPMSFMDLTRYLKFDFQTVFNISVPLLQTSTNGGLEEMEMMVSLCKHCYTVLNQFGGLHQELELIRLKLNATVQKIHQLIRNGDGDEERVKQYRKLTASNNPVELINASIAENLRKETLEKCSLRVNASLPELKLDKLSGNEGGGAGCSSKLLRIGGKSEELPDYRKEVLIDQLPKSNSIAQEKDPLDIEDCVSLAVPDEPQRETPVPRHKKRMRMKKCHVCSKIVTQGAWSAHMARHTGTRLQQCPYCPKVFRDSGNLRVHKLLNHLTSIFADSRDPSQTSIENFKSAIDQVLNVFPISKPSADGRRYACPNCTKYYRHKADLKCHMISTHFEELTLQLRKVLYGTNQPLLLLGSAAASNFTNLNVVKKKTKTPPPLINIRPAQGSIPIFPIPSLSGSSSSKPQTCPICGLTLKNSGNLRVHYRRQHGGETPYKCSDCHQSFNDQRKLRDHRITMHLQNFFKNCNIEVHLSRMSPTDFVTAMHALITRSITTLNDSTFECNFCNKQYRGKRDVKFHLVDIHRHDLVSRLAEDGHSENNPNVPSLLLISSTDTDNVNPPLSSRHQLIEQETEIFYCLHCGQQFNNRYDHQVHLSTVHRFEMFVKYFPTGTDSDEVISVVDHLLQQECNLVEKNFFGCMYCDSKFAELATIQTHFLVDHFAEVVPKFKKYITASSSEAVNLVDDISDANCTSDFTFCETVIKPEVDAETEVMIVPD